MLTFIHQPRWLSQPNEYLPGWTTGVRFPAGVPVSHWLWQLFAPATDVIIEIIIGVLSRTLKTQKQGDGRYEYQYPG
jgi:hypothetical protein